MSKTILIATKNKHKAAELAALFASLAEVMNLADWEAIQGQTLAEPDENGQSFQENALIKSRAYARATSLITLADDSGLSVDSLGGAPGVHSARYGRPGFTDSDRCDFLLQNMSAHTDRRAFFTSVLSLSKPGGESLWWEGRAHGQITLEKSGEHGFGYDPVFYYPPFGHTFAQLSPAEKNKISHRAQASQAFLNDMERVRAFISA